MHSSMCIMIERISLNATQDASTHARQRNAKRETKKIGKQKRTMMGANKKKLVNPRRCWLGNKP